MTPTTTAAVPESAAQDVGTRSANPGLAEDRSMARPGVEAGAARARGKTFAKEPVRVLPSARNVMAVIARPGRESVQLGALMYAFRRSGARVSLLCLTRGEASPLNSTCERLETVRLWELQVAAGLLGVSSVTVSDYPDGGLSLALVPALAERVRRAVRQDAPDLLLVVDPAAGDPDDAWVAQAACLAAGSAGVPVLARTLPGARIGWQIDLGAEAAAARAVQRCAAGAHVSQSAAGPMVRRCLDLLGGREQLFWLVRPPADFGAGEEQAAAASFAPALG
ncbi:MAG TPA: PIG-L family deacetylase [Streptosporangiaceae bacterium]